MDEQTVRLEPGEIITTINRLRLRILDRFPESGLSRICKIVLDLATDADTQIEWIERPRWRYRIPFALFIVITLAALVYVVGAVNVSNEGFNIDDFLQMCEAGINNLVLIGAAVVFLVTIETRAKRNRVVKCVNRLRSIAHLIEAHQLSKDPTTPPDGSGSTPNSPRRDLKPYEMNRYLAYCSEMLSVIGKIGFLYVQDFHDPVAVASVNDLETLTTGLSRKIWQKIMILKA